jgi:hypothetical protein
MFEPNDWRSYLRISPSVSRSYLATVVQTMQVRGPEVRNIILSQTQKKNHCWGGTVRHSTAFGVSLGNVTDRLIAYGTCGNWYYCSLLTISLSRDRQVICEIEAVDDSAIRSEVTRS